MRAYRVGLQIVIFMVYFAMIRSFRLRTLRIGGGTRVAISAAGGLSNLFTSSVSAHKVELRAVNLPQQSDISVGAISTDGNSTAYDAAVTDDKSTMLVVPPLKLMIFIDGTWLFYSMVQGRSGHRSCPLRRKLGDAWKMTHEYDWPRLPQLIRDNIAEQVKRQLGIERAVDLRRVSVFTSLREDTHKDSSREKMFEDLQLANFDVHRYVTATDQEKCVDIALAVEMLYMATVHGAYDIAVVVTGDKDFMPAMQKTRLLAKQVAICSMRNSCNQDLVDPSSQIRDFDFIWLDDYINELLVPRADADESLEADAMILDAVGQIITSSPTGFVTSRDLGRELQSRQSSGRHSLLALVKRYHVQLRAFLERYQRFFVLSNNEQIVKPDFLVSLVPGVDGLNIDINAEYDISEIRSLDTDLHRSSSSNGNTPNGRDIYGTEDFVLGPFSQGVIDSGDTEELLFKLAIKLVQINNGRIDSRNFGRALKRIPIIKGDADSDALSVAKATFGSISALVRQCNQLKRNNIGTHNGMELYEITLTDHSSSSSSDFSYKQIYDDTKSREREGFERRGDGRFDDEYYNLSRQYDGLRVVDLKDLLKERGLSTGGVKDDLLARLVWNDKQKAGAI